MSVARTAAGVEGSLLIHPDGGCWSPAPQCCLCEMRMFLLPPEDGHYLCG